MTQTPPRTKEPARLILAGIGWLVVWRLARLLPERLAYRLFEWSSRMSWRRNHRRRALVTDNLSAVVPPERLEQTVRDAFRWYGRYWTETFRMPDLSHDELLRRFSSEGQEALDEAHATGTGAVVALPHFGNWDAGGRWAADRWGLTVVVEVLRPRMLFERFVQHRRALGMKIVPLDRGSDPVRRCLQHLADGDILALVADRDLSGSGIPVTMFGRRTKLPPGPAVLALRSGAPLMAAVVYQSEEGTWMARILPPLERPGPDVAEPVAELTQRLATAFESLIASDPAQWHMFSRFWIDEPTRP